MTVTLESVKIDPFDSIPYVHLTYVGPFKASVLKVTHSFKGPSQEKVDVT